MDHSPRFLALVNQARRAIAECTVNDVKAKLDSGHRFRLVDVREESEWAKDRLPQAIHLGKGVIERDAEKALPDLAEEIVLYCGGGYRSALAGKALLDMGYQNVISMDGGIREWRQAGFPVVK